MTYVYSIENWVTMSQHVGPTTLPRNVEELKFFFSLIFQKGDKKEWHKPLVRVFYID